jgi:hypothetical protein
MEAQTSRRGFSLAGSSANGDGRNTPSEMRVMARPAPDAQGSKEHGQQEGERGTGKPQGLVVVLHALSLARGQGASTAISVRVWNCGSPRSAPEFPCAKLNRATQSPHGGNAHTAMPDNWFPAPKITGGFPGYALLPMLEEAVSIDASNVLSTKPDTTPGFMPAPLFRPRTGTIAPRLNPQWIEVPAQPLSIGRGLLWGLVWQVGQVWLDGVAARVFGQTDFVGKNNPATAEQELGQLVLECSEAISDSPDSLTEPLPEMLPKPKPVTVPEDTQDNDTVKRTRIWARSKAGRRVWP